MGKVLILNGSPRAPKSNSRRYAEIFSTACKLPSDYFNISKTNHAALCQKMSEYSDVLLVFPLYADSLPVGLLNFLKYLEANKVSMIVITNPIITFIIMAVLTQMEVTWIAGEHFKPLVWAGAILFISGAILVLKPSNQAIKEKIKTKMEARKRA